MKKRLLSLVLALALLAGCTPSGDGGGSSEPAASEGKDFVLGMETFTASLDPAKDYDGWYTVRYGIGETPVKLTDELSIEPWLLEDFANTDPTTWELTLKEGIKFSNGKDLTPEIFVANLERVGEINERASSLKEADYSIDGQVITVKTAQPSPTLINDLADPYASIIDTEEIDEAGTNVIGTGPFKIVDFTPDAEIKLEKNQDYWDGEVGLDTVTVTKILDKETGSMALQNGEINGFYELNPESYQIFDADENYTTSSLATSRVFAMYYNTDRLDDLNLRRAIHLAIDKESIADNLLNGMMTPTTGIFPSGTAYGDDHIDQEETDLDEAKKLLEEAGLVDTDGDGYVEKDGDMFELQIHYYKRLSLEEIATETQSALDRLGIRSHLNSHDNQEYFETGDYDLGFYAVVTAPTGDPEAYLRRITQEGGVENFNKFSDPEVDGLIDELSATFDPQERADLALEIQEKILAHHAHEFIGFNKLNSAAQAEFTNFTPHPTEYYILTKDIGL